MTTRSNSYLLIALLVALLVCPPPLMAAVIVVGGSCTLVDAIHSANTDTAVGGCTAGAGADEIELTGDVTLTAVDNTDNGPNGLPSVSSEMTIRSSDGTPRTIERGSGAPDFRIFHIGAGGTLSLERVVVSNGNLGGSFGGGGIYNRGQLALTNSTVSGNAATYGGGIFNASITGPHVDLINSTVSGNSADYGGGIFNTPFSSANLTNSTVSGNSATESGGGIYNAYASAYLANSTVSGNTATYGGGIYNYYNTSVLLINSTVSGNLANFGGGIGNFYSSNASLIHSTLSGNWGILSGGGIFNSFSTATLTGNLVGHSGPGGGNCGGGPVTDGGDNLADDATCGSIPATLTGLDPDLAHHGGPTLTHALLPGSNAIDLAGNCGLATDQRLASRDDGSCDSGSFEFTTIFLDGFESGDTSAWSATVP